MRKFALVLALAFLAAAASPFLLASAGSEAIDPAASPGLVAAWLAALPKVLELSATH